jgi:putative ABC transport system permease protein
MMKKEMKSPPHLAKWIICRLSYYEKEHALSGAIEADYFDIQTRYGTILSWIWYWFCTMGTLFHYMKFSLLWSTIMFKNYLKTALRNIKRNKNFFLINILGLAIGISCCILILQYIRHEFSFDKFHENSMYIYRIIQHQEGNIYQGTDIFNSVPAILAPSIREDFPQDAKVTRVKNYERQVRYKNNQFYEKQFLYVEPEFLDIFSFPVVKGDPKTALEAPHSVMITKDMALKYFGDEDPINKTININNEQDYRITGVLENVPDNSHLKFDFLASFSSLLGAWGHNQLTSWQNSSVWTYLQLVKNLNPQKFDAQLKKYNTVGFGGHPASFRLQHLTDIHLGKMVAFDSPGRGDKRYIYLYSAIALLILLIVCFNYTNLSIARSFARGKEIGIRKVVGAKRRSIIFQFQSESLLFSFFALLLALILVHFALPIFNHLVERNIKFDLSTDIIFKVCLISLGIFTGLISGIYPAVFLSSFKPIKVLKGRTELCSRNTSNVRKSLIIIQFAISICLIICTLVINNQLHYIKNKKLGLDKNSIITIPMTNKSIWERFNMFKNELNRQSNILDITASKSLPTEIDNTAQIKLGGQNRGETLRVWVNWVDYYFIDFYKMNIVQGRNFIKDSPQDLENAYIINETAAKAIRLENAVGKTFEMWGIKGLIIGVVEDFHFAPLHSKIEPLVLKLNPDNLKVLSVRINSFDISNTLTFIQNKWNEVFPDFPFVFSFLDKKIESMYKAEMKLGQSFNYFTLIAIILSCLGLLGLSSYMTEKKTKEIGIRKVLGATAPNIFFLLSKEFTKFVLLANTIAWPLAYYFMNKWLQNFAFRTNLNILIFLLSGLTALMIALLTVSYQTIKAATANPVDSLRYE